MTDSSEDHGKAVKVFELVSAKTERREIGWKATSDRRTNAYEADLESGNVEIGWEDDDGAPPCDFRIYTVGPPYTLVYRISGRDSPELQAQIAELHTLVERQVKGVEEVFDALLKELGG